MKKSTIVLLLVLCGVALGGWWIAARKSVTVPSPKQLLAAAPIRIDETFQVPPQRSQEWTWEPPDGRTPGLLEGSWECRGSTSGIAGANDDTLVGFALRGPDNRVIQQLDHPVSGNFSLRCTSAGKYTFVFDNGGIVRSSARKVTLHGAYHPE
jgi:hypothetical protein